MSLTTGRGPLGKHPAGRFTAPVPDGVAYVEPHPRRIQALVDGSVVLDTGDDGSPAGVCRGEQHES